MCVSTLSGVSPTELAAATPGAPKWFQLYWSRDHGFTGELVDAVVEAGFRALVLTVDLPVAGRRERDIREAFALPDDLPIPNLPFELRRTDFHTALHESVDPLGARAVLAGRAVIWGLAADGEAGATRVLELLQAEIELGLRLLGAPTPDAVTRAHVRRAGPAI
jgi:isopentenyl diphosphate isomerase/L-lactate dehydrogenase-like FMN-dependent dehydrogenase